MVNDAVVIGRRLIDAQLKDGPGTIGTATTAVMAEIGQRFTGGMFQNPGEAARWIGRLVGWLGAEAATAEAKLRRLQAEAAQRN